METQANNKVLVADKLRDELNAQLERQAANPSAFADLMNMQVNLQLMVAKSPLFEQRFHLPFEQKAEACFPKMGTIEWQQSFNTQVLSMQAEISESLEWTNWKPWRKNYATTMTPQQVQDAKFELIDQFCFLMNAFVLLKGTPQEFCAMYFSKMEENFSRQQRGY